MSLKCCSTYKISGSETRHIPSTPAMKGLVFMRRYCHFLNNAASLGNEAKMFYFFAVFLKVKVSRVFPAKIIGLNNNILLIFSVGKMVF